MTTINDPTKTISYDEQLGFEIKGWLARRGMKQKDIAAAIGITQAAVSQRLIGRVSFSVNELMSIAHLLDITLGDLLGPELLNRKSPRPAVQDEGSSGLPQLDSNQQPLD